MCQTRPRKPICILMSNLLISLGEEKWGLGAAKGGRLHIFCEYQHLCHTSSYAYTSLWAKPSTCAIQTYMQYWYLSKTGSWAPLGNWAEVSTCEALPLLVSLAVIVDWLCRSPTGTRLGFTIFPTPRSWQPEPDSKWPCCHLATI